MTRRISVVGNSGSGKTTVAAQIAHRLGVEHIELDAIHHQADWTPMAKDEMLAILSDKVSAPGWVVDGNYAGMVQPEVWNLADTVVWLDLPRRTVMRQILVRTVRRMATREELWNGNRERWRFLLKRNPQENIVLWAWTRHRPVRHRYEVARQEQRWSHLEFIRITRRRQIELLVSGL